MRILRLVMTLALLLVAGCFRVRHETDPVQVEPIHITVDVNLRIQEELQDFFQEIDKRDPTIQSPAPESTTGETP